MSELRQKFNRTVILSVLVITFSFVCAAIVEWTREMDLPVQGMINDEWVARSRNFLYLMAMFNIFAVRYVVMRVYTAPGVIDTAAVISRIRRADTASMMLSTLPTVYGLLLYLLAGDVIDFYLLFGLSLLYCVIFFPRLKKWEETLGEHNREGDGCAVQ